VPQLIHHRLANGVLVGQECGQKVGKPLRQLLKPSWIVSKPVPPTGLAAET